MTKVGLLFSGQGAQVPGMGKDFYEKIPVFAETIDQASEICGFDLTECFGSSEMLKQTKYVQPALCAFSYGVFKALKNAAPDLNVVGGIGLSLGEYPALIASSMLDFETGMKLVSKRAEFMQEDCDRHQSSMAAILKPDVELVEKICAEISTDEKPVSIANYNSPKQVVIGGDDEAVKKASEKLSEEGKMRVVELNVNGAFHTPLLKTSSQRLGEVLKAVSFKDPEFVIESNTDRIPFTKENAAEILQRQVMSPTHFASCVEKMIKDCEIETFVEIGPGETLSKFVRQIDRNIGRASVETLEKMQKFSL